jgi:hypothetical protein
MFLIMFKTSSFRQIFVAGVVAFCVSTFIALPATHSTVRATSTAPTFSWIAGGDGTGSSNAPVNAVAVDSLGNSYITGWISGTLDFAGDGIGGANSFGDVATANQDAYLAQYNSGGVLQWVKHFAGTGTDFTTGVTADSNNNVIVVGSFAGTIDLAGDGIGGSGDLVSLGSNDLFTAKYSSAGNFVWAARAGGTGNDSGWQGAVTVDSSRNVYLNVPFTGTADFGQDGIGGVGDLVSLGGTADNAVVKYSSSGAFQWAKRIGGTGDEWPQEITTDSSSNVLVVGNSRSTVTDFGGDGIGGTDDVVNRGNYDAYMAKYSPSGVLIWAKSIGSTGYDWGADISSGENGSIMVTAYFSNTVDSAGDGVGGANSADDLISAGTYDILVAKYSGDGALTWSKRIGSTGDDKSVDGDTDSSGNYYITGSFVGTVDFAGDGAGGNGDVVSAGLNDVFTAKFSTSGSFEWVKRGGGTSADGGFLGGIDVSSDGSTVHIGDLFAGTVDFAENGIGGANSSGDKTASGSASFPFLVKYLSPVTLVAQTVTWSPTSTLSVSSSPMTPSSLATTNGNGAITYAVTSAGTTGCAVGLSTGLLTFSSAGSCTIRATAAGTSQWITGTTSVTFVISETSSTTAPSSPNTTAASGGSGQSSVSTIAPGGTSSTVPTPLAVASSGTSTSLPSSRSSISSTSTSTVPSSTTTSSIPAPKAPELKVGESSTLVDGKAVSTALSRSDNKITAKAAGVAATIWGLDKDGRTVALDIDGNVRLNIGDKVVVQASGFAAGEDVSVWLFSVPSRLGVIAADDSGKVEGTFDLPKNVEMGDHRLVFDGTRSDGKPVTLGFGVAIGQLETSSSLSRVLIAVPVLIAIFIGFFIPAVTRRRRKELAA